MWVLVSRKVSTEWLNQKTEGEILVIFGLIPSVAHPSQVLFSSSCHTITALLFLKQMFC